MQNVGIGSTVAQDQPVDAMSPPGILPRSEAGCAFGLLNCSRRPGGAAGGSFWNSSSYRANNGMRRPGEFRYVITDMIRRAGSGHLGGALSLVEIVVTLYWRVLQIRPQATPITQIGTGSFCPRVTRAGGVHGACVSWVFPEDDALRR